MTFGAFSLRIAADGNVPARAVDILTDALRARCPGFGSAAPDGKTILLEYDPLLAGQEAFAVTKTDGSLCFRAGRLRGFLYAIGLFLRKLEVQGNDLVLTEDITGHHSPDKPIRGHQLGYRPLSNTYDKWDVPDYVRYMTELSFFGMNAVELIPLGEKNELMIYDAVTMAAKLSEEIRALDMDVSVWIPNGDGEEEAELKAREEMFAALPCLDAVFIPGADPGDLPADAMVKRAVKIGEALHKSHPAAKLWVSAQAPHNDKQWGEVFLREVNAHKTHFAGVIQGPNRAFDIDVLRERLDPDLPIRYYPDICHTVRCEYPLTDVPYLYNTGLGRESVCPRSVDYKRLHGAVSPYTVGSVTYSDGVNDDVNKAVWCALEWDPSLTPEAIVEDYARCYLYGRDVGRLAAGILSAERSFHRSPADPKNRFTAWALEASPDETNWRANSLYFLSLCLRFLQEKYLREIAEAAVYAGGPIPDDKCGDLVRLEIDRVAGLLYDEVGMQLDVEHYHAYGPERGATLESIDLPISDLKRLHFVWETARAAGEDPAKALQTERAESAAPENGVYISFALHGLKPLGAEQPGDYYINYLGDRKNVNDGTLPTRLARVFDHYTLDMAFTGLTDADHRLTLTVYRLPEHFFTDHTVTANGVRLGGFTPAETAAKLPKDFGKIDLTVPKVLLKDGAVRLHIEEPETGFGTAEVRLEPVNGTEGTR